MTQTYEKYLPKRINEKQFGASGQNFKQMVVLVNEKIDQLMGDFEVAKDDFDALKTTGMSDSMSLEKGYNSLDKSYDQFKKNLAAFTKLAQKHGI
jgi:hypothetical protein